MKKIILVVSILIIHITLYAYDLKPIIEKVDVVKQILSKWDKSNDPILLEKALVLLIELKADFGNKTGQNLKYEKLRQEVYMLYFWTNKSRRVKAFGKEKDQNSKNEIKEKSSLEHNKQNIGIVDSIISANLIGTESEYIIDSFRDIKEFTKNHPTAYYQSEFMYRDFYFDYPDSTNAEVAKELADSLIPKIEVFNKDKSHRIKEITSNIYNFDKLYKARKFKEISEKLKGLFDEEKGYITKHIMGELIKEYNYLDITMEAIDKLIQNKKSTPISAGIVGIKFKGSLVRANKESLSIKTQMGTISLPWKKN